jgi:hypothetical protein
VLNVSRHELRRRHTQTKVQSYVNQDMGIRVVTKNDSQADVVGNWKENLDEPLPVDG